MNSCLHGLHKTMNKVSPSLSMTFNLLFFVESHKQNGIFDLNSNCPCNDKITSITSPQKIV